MFKVVWDAWRAPKQPAAVASEGSEPLLLSHGSGALDSSLHGGANSSSAAALAAAMGGTGGAGGGMGRRSQSLQWLNAATEVRVAGACAAVHAGPALALVWSAGGRAWQHSTRTALLRP